MQAFIELAIPGLVVGCLYGLIGMAFAIVYKATRVINFALGEMMMLTAYTAFAVQGKLALPFPLLVLITLGIAAAVGAAVELLVVRPMQSEPIFSIVMATIGVAVALRSLVVLFWGPMPQPLDTGLPDRWISILGVQLTLGQIAAAGLLAVTCGFVVLFFRYTSFGLAMRATASSETTAMLMGIRVRAVHSFAWIISTVVAGLTGLLMASIYNLGPELYLQGIKGFPATILGGLDSILGSALGGLLIGVVENLAGARFGSGVKEIAGFVIVIFVLMVRPFGLFGQREIERV